MVFEKPVLVYIPCHNCEKWIVDILLEVPAELEDSIECLVIDNHSTDSTSDRVVAVRKNRDSKFKIHLIRTNENIGYAGSQKLAYSLATDSPNVKKVIMLHGDGQYSPSLLTTFAPLISQNHAIACGYRDNKTYGRREETPPLTRLVIRTLSRLESLATGHRLEEWHSGFVMYDAEFLARIPLSRLSETMHIDGEFQMCSAVLGVPTTSVPIYKKYRDCEALNLTSRIRHVLDVFKLIVKFRQGYYHRILDAGTTEKIAYDYKVVP